MPKELSKCIELSTSNVEGTGSAPSYGRELVFSESDGEDSYFELIPEKGKGKWSHIKHVKDGMYVTRASVPSSPYITLMLSDTGRYSNRCSPQSWQERRRESQKYDHIKVFNALQKPHQGILREEEGGGP